MIPKPKREIDKKYLEYIKTLPCACKDETCVGEIAPHHTTTKGAGGSDYLTVPLCAKHHTQCHDMGRYSFQRKLGVSFDEIVNKCQKDWRGSDG